jgi:hypothetical protein
VRTITRALALADRGTRPVVNVLPGYYGPAHNGETLPLRIGSGGATHAGLLLRAVDGGVTFDLAGSRTAAVEIGANALDVRLSDFDFVNGEPTEDLPADAPPTRSSSGSAGNGTGPVAPTSRTTGSQNRSKKKKKRR